MESMAQSMMSAPALAHASCVATPVPAVSWVCTCSTRSGNASRSAVTSCVAARGFSSPAAPPATRSFEQPSSRGSHRLMYGNFQQLWQHVTL